MRIASITSPGLPGFEGQATRLRARQDRQRKKLTRVTFSGKLRSRIVLQTWALDITDLNADLAAVCRITLPARQDPLPAPFPNAVPSWSLLAREYQSQQPADYGEFTRIQATWILILRTGFRVGGAAARDRLNQIARDVLDGAGLRLGFSSGSGSRAWTSRSNRSAAR